MCITFVHLSKVSWLYLWRISYGLSILVFFFFLICSFFHQFFYTVIINVAVSSPIMSSSFVFQLQYPVGCVFLPLELVCWYPQNNLLGIWLGLRLKPMDQVGKSWHLDDIESSCPWAWNIYPFKWFFNFFDHSFVVYLIYIFCMWNQYWCLLSSFVLVICIFLVSTARDLSIWIFLKNQVLILLIFFSLLTCNLSFVDC